VAGAISGERPEASLRRGEFSDAIKGKAAAYPQSNCVAIDRLARLETGDSPPEKERRTVLKNQRPQSWRSEAV